MIGAVRPSSLEKPSAQALAKAGVELRSTDFEADTPEQLEKLLAGVDVLIITVLINTDQKPLLRAAKAVGSLIRVIPSDFGTVAPRGVMKMHDTVCVYTVTHVSRLTGARNSTSASSFRSLVWYPDFSPRGDTYSFVIYSPTPLSK